MGFWGGGQSVFETKYVLYLSPTAGLTASVYSHMLKIPFAVSGRSLNRADLFTELPFLLSCLPKPSFTESLPLIQTKGASLR